MDFLKFPLCLYLLFSEFKIIENYIRSQNYAVFPIKNYVLSSTQISKHNEIHTKRAVANCLRITLQTQNQPYELCVYPDEHPRKDIQILVYKNYSEQNWNPFDLGISFVRGYVESHPHNSFIKGYIESGKFYGKVFVHSHLFYVEKLKSFQILYDSLKENSSKNALIYVGSNDNMMANVHYQNESFRVYDRLRFQKIPLFNTTKKKSKGYTCTIMAIVDRSFLKIIALDDIMTATRLIISTTENAESIFRSTDFDEDGSPDNIGIKLHKIIIDGSTGDYGVSKYIEPYVNEPIDGKKYLNRLVKFPLLQYYCLVIAFTAQQFQNRAIGLSYTAVVEITDHYIITSGGICDFPNIFNECHNILVVTYILQNGMRAPQFLTEISLVHELGHSFGSDHDPSNCSDHLMAPQTLKPSSNVNSLSFSICSKKQISEIMQLRGSCFRETSEPFCGNGIIEKDEDCDCGHPINCIARDKCCIPNGEKGLQCKVNRGRGFDCHPAQGLCCLQNCKYRNVSHINLDCSDMQRNCPCSKERHCKCGLLGVCIEDECHSTECVRIGLRECPCPSKLEKCQTCCKITDDECLPAVEATRKVIIKNKYILSNLSTIKDSIEFLDGDILEKFCDYKLCIHLVFRTFKNNDFCTFRGQLSFCKDNKCLVPNKIKNIIYPVLKFKEALHLTSEPERQVDATKSRNMSRAPSKTVLLFGLFAFILGGFMNTSTL